MVFMFFPSVFILDGYGNKPALIFALIASVTGAWVQEYADKITGEVISNVGLPFILNGVTRMSNLWFGTHERLIATTFALFMTQLGGVLGELIPEMMHNPTDPD